MEKERDDLLLRERAARIQAETAARARDEFLAIVSHELRAPLNGIQSWTHVLDNYTADVTPLGKRAIEGIKTGVAQQVRLIEDLLDATGMMSGKLRLTRRPMAALPAIQAAVESVKPMADEKSLALDYDYRISREQIEGDPDRIQQIVWNLLTNAVKFTAEGGRIMLTASREDSCLRIDVRDTGIGIAPAFMPRLFDRFSQQDSSSTRHASGLGLGLFVVRHLVELHGGSISVESKGKGHGSQFTVLIPLRARGSCRQAAHCHDACSLPSLQGLDILLIDDDAEARESLGALMSSQGARVTTAASGADAIACLDGSASALPHLVICDIAMPGEDGYAVLRRLRNWRDTSGDRPLRHTPALALTAFSQREDRLRALSAGFQMHAAKPVAADELAIMIMNMTRRDL
jgi:CheY-like chemotaxis protein